MNRVIAICVTALLVHAGVAHAEPGDAAAPRAVGGSASIRQSIKLLDYSAFAVPNPSSASAQQAPSQRRERSIGWKIAGAAIGAVGGLYAGGYLGAVIEGDRCNCDDPGLMGALIGAPIGAVVGGIVGFKLF